jgi:hypothetical protein
MRYNERERERPPAAIEAPTEGHGTETDQGGNGTMNETTRSTKHCTGLA